MKTRDTILTEALKTQDPAQLYALVEAALDLAQFNGAQRAMAEGRVAKLTEQVARQRAVIDNLEKTLWNKKL